MLKLDKQQIQEIAEQLDAGFRAFYHKPTGKLTFLIDSSKFPAGDWEEEEIQTQEEIITNQKDYIEIEVMGSSDLYRVMVDFTEQLQNPRLQGKLFEVLGKRGPFREFKELISSSGNYRENWFAFKNQQYVNWVNQQLESKE